MPVVNDEFKIAFFGTPKVASTSVKRLFLELEEGYDAARDPTRTRVVHMTYPTKARSLEEDLHRYQDYWKITIVRDPIQRALSTYFNRIVTNKDTHKGRFPVLKAKLLGLPLDPTPDEFYEKMRRYFLQSRVVAHHLSLQSRYIGRDLSQYDKVYRLEDLANFVSDLSTRTGKDLQLQHVQKSTKPLTLDMLSPRAVQSIRSFVRADYDLLTDYYKPW
jgi:hypothetical protein